jgi:hypothetical protein
MPDLNQDQIVSSRITLVFKILPILPVIAALNLGGTWFVRYLIGYS